MNNDAVLIDSVMSDFCSRPSCFSRLIKYAIMKPIGIGLEGSSIDFPDWNDLDEYYHFEGVKLLQFDPSSDWEDVVLVSQKEFLEICLYYIGEFKKEHPEGKDPLIPLAEEKIKKDLATMK